MLTRQGMEPGQSLTILFAAYFTVVSFAAVIRVVTQRSSPLTAVSGEERCVTTLITAAKETNFTEVEDLNPAYQDSSFKVVLLPMAKQTVSYEFSTGAVNLKHL